MQQASLPLPAKLTGGRPAFLRSRWIGRIWLAMVAVLAALVFQQVAGWPARTKWKVEPTTLDAVQSFRFPKNLAPGGWHRGLVRVSRDDRFLPGFASQESFEQGAIESYLVRENKIHIRAGDRGSMAADKIAWTVLVPWTLRAEHFVIVMGLAALFIALLVWARNPLPITVGARLLQRWSRPGWPWPALMLAGFAFAAAVLLRVLGFSYPSWENDTSSYFRSVFRVVDGGLPLVTPDRPFAYPVVIGTLLRLFPDFRAILVLHMVATLAAATAIGALVWLAGERLFTHPVARSLGRILGIFVFAAFALNETILQREWSLLSEAWAAFYLAVQVALVWLLTCRRRSLPPNLWLFAAFCLGGLLTFFTRPNWGFALGLLPFPWVIACLLHAGTRRAFLIWSACGAAVLVTLFAATFGFQAYCSPRRSVAALYDRARALVCWHVPLIQAELDRRLRQPTEDPLRPVLAEMAQTLQVAVETAKTEGSGSYPTLSFDPDRLYFFTLAGAPLFRALPLEERTKLCTELFTGGLQHRPDLYLRKVAGQMRLFFICPYQKPNAYLPNIEMRIARSKQAITNREMPARFTPAYAEVINKAKQLLAQPWPSPARLVLNIRLSLIFAGLTSAFVWSLLLPLLLVGSCLVRPAARRWTDWRLLAPVFTVAVWSLGSALLSALSSAATQGLDVQRYIQLPYPLTLLSQALWPLLGVSLLLTLRRSRRAR